MRFRLTTVRNSRKNIDDDIESLVLSQTSNSDKNDISEILDLSFSCNIKEKPKSMEPKEVIVDKINEFETSVNEEITEPTFDEEEVEIITNNKNTMNIFKSLTKKVFNTILTLSFAFVIAVLINIYVCRPSKVSGESMVPTLRDNETVYISQLPYVFGDIEFGDIVVIDSNLEAKRTFITSVAETLKYNVLTKDLFDYDVDIFWIKRVIGVEGDVIEFKDNAIYRNGKKLYEKYINTQDIYTYPNGITVTVKEGYIYVMGDNRNISRDSRQEGQIPVSNVVGKLVFH